MNAKKFFFKKKCKPTKKNIQSLVFFVIIRLIKKNLQLIILDNTHTKKIFLQFLVYNVLT